MADEVSVGKCTVMHTIKNHTNDEVTSSEITFAMQEQHLQNELVINSSMKVSAQYSQAVKTEYKSLKMEKENNTENIIMLYDSI